MNIAKFLRTPYFEEHPMVASVKRKLKIDFLCNKRHQISVFSTRKKRAKSLKNFKNLLSLFSARLDQILESWRSKSKHWFLTHHVIHVNNI